MKNHQKKNMNQKFPVKTTCTLTQAQQKIEFKQRKVKVKSSVSFHKVILQGGIDTNSEWDEENSDSNNKYKNYNPGMKAAKNNKKDVKMMDDLDFDDI